MGKGIHPCRKNIPKAGFGGKYGHIFVIFNYYSPLLEVTL